MKALTILYLIVWFVSDAYQTVEVWLLFAVLVLRGALAVGVPLGAHREDLPYVSPPACSLSIQPHFSNGPSDDPTIEWISLSAEPPQPFSAGYYYSDTSLAFIRRQVILGWKIGGRTVGMTTTDIWISFPLSENVTAATDAVTAAIAWSIFIPVSFRLRRKFIDFARRRRESRRASLLARHLCPTCGYDLRATPHQCPECGTPTA